MKHTKINNSLKSPSEHMKDILMERNKIIVWHGTPHLIQECALRSGLFDVKCNRERHPLNILNNILLALDNSEHFDKGYINFNGITSVAFRLKDNA